MSKSRPQYDKPSRKKLKEQIQSTSMSTAARYFCGHKSAINVIREWCDEYKIPYPTPEIRRARWSIPKPTCDQLEHILHTKETVREVAKHFDVTPSTIYIWIKYFKLRR